MSSAFHSVSAPLSSKHHVPKVQVRSRRVASSSAPRTSTIVGFWGQKKPSGIKENIMEAIGNTPMVKLTAAVVGTEATVVGKMESLEPCSSVKDRLALAMIDDAEKKGLIAPGKTTLVEATSGNTGIAMAMIAARKGYRAIFTMPASASLERRIAMRSFGAELVLTDPAKGAKGAVLKKDQLLKEIPNAVNLDQFGNEANPDMHYRTTGPEIWEQTEGKIDILVSGVGTGGSVIGAGKFLKEKNPNIKVVAVEPKESPVLSGGNPGPHPIQGIGAGFVPDVFSRSRHLVDEVIQVSGADAIETAKKLSTFDGLMVGPSSGAAVKVATELANRPENKGKLIVAIIPSFGERYMSSLLYNAIREECQNMQWVGTDAPAPTPSAAPAVTI